MYINNYYYYSIITHMKNTILSYNSTSFNPCYIKNGLLEDDIFINNYIVTEHDLFDVFKYLNNFVINSEEYISELVNNISFINDEFDNYNNNDDIYKLHETIDNTIIQLKKITINNILFEDMNIIKGEFYSITSNLLHEIADYVIKYNIHWPICFTIENAFSKIEMEEKNKKIDEITLQISCPEYY